MAGIEENIDLSMDMISLGDIVIPENEEQENTVEDNTTTQELEDKVVDGENQESVNNSAEEESPDSIEAVNTEEESPATDDNVFKMLTGFLADRGLVSAPKEELKIETDEDFAKFIGEQIKSNEYSDLNDSQKVYLESLREGVPDEFIHNHLRSVDAFDKLTNETIKDNADIQRDLIIEGLKAQGFDEGYASKHFKRVSDSGEGFEEALMFRDKLKEVSDQRMQQELEETKKANEESVKIQQKQVEDLKKAVYETEKVFDSFPTTKGLQDKVYELMTKPVAYSKDGIPMNALMKYQQENPVDYNKNLHYLFELTEGFKNLRRFETKAASKAVNTFKAKLQKSNFITESSGNPSFKNDTDVDNIVDVDF